MPYLWVFLKCTPYTAFVWLLEYEGMSKQKWKLDNGVDQPTHFIEVSDNENNSYCDTLIT